jgi:hypothetical protein
MLTILVKFKEEINCAYGEDFTTHTDAIKYIFYHYEEFCSLGENIFTLFANFNIQHLKPTYDTTGGKEPTRLYSFPYSYNFYNTYKCPR